jgi:hypothetical protein
MVVSKTDTSHLIIRTQTGTTPTGKPILKNRAYTNVKVTASDEDVYAIGEAMANLQSDPVVAVERLNSNTLTKAE